MSAEPTDGTAGQGTPKYTFKEEFRAMGDQLVSRTKELVHEGNVRRLIVRTREGRKVAEIPMTAGVIAGGILAVISPFLTVLSAVAGLLAGVKIEIVHQDQPPAA